MSLGASSFPVNRGTPHNSTAGQRPLLDGAAPTPQPCTCGSDAYNRDLDPWDEDTETELLGFDDLVSEGLPPEEARAVLGPHSALTRAEVNDRLGLVHVQKEARP
jgi:hypothetical protein